MQHAFRTSYRLFTRFVALGATVCGLVDIPVFADTNCVAPPAGLISWWRAEGSGTDHAGTNDATLLSGAGYVPGEVGTGFSLDGVDDRVIVADSHSLHFGTNDFSFEAWIRAYAGTPDYGVMSILDKHQTPSTDRAVGLQFYLLEGRLSLFMADAPMQPGASSSFTAPTPNLLDGQFHHVAATVQRQSATGGRLYVDGQLVLTFNPTLEPGDISNTEPLRIGNHANPSLNCTFKGTIDEMSVYGRSLSSAEIQAIYGAANIGKCTTPTAPAILTQPTNRTVVAGETATFTVLASGTQPLSYQWLFNGTNISGETGTVLTLLGVQPAQAGDYSVQVTNAIGTVISSNAVLTVNPSPLCAAPPAGLVSWWRGEANALDSAGGNHGLPEGQTAYGVGRVGQGLVFDGNEDLVRLGNAANLQDLSIEAWIRRTSSTVVSYSWGGAGQFICCGTRGYNFGLAPDNRPFFGKVDVSVVQPSATITDTSWHHVAVTKTGSTVVFYVDGVAYSAPACTDVFEFPTTLGIGARPDNQGGGFYGAIDELAVYGRALTATEVQAIYGAGAAGKCATAVPPSIFTSPTNQTVVAGDTAAFEVVAGGTMPLSYQWLFNGTNINGATQSTLTLPGAQPAQAGDYSVQVTNSFGAITSSIAVLTVNPARLCAAPPAGLISWWRAEGGATDGTGGNHGTLAGNTTFATGRVGQSFVFDGDGDTVSLGTAANLRLQDFTIEAWIQRSSASAVTYFWDGGAQLFGGGSGGYNFGIMADGRLFMSKVGVSAVQASAVVADTNLHHVAVTKSGSSVVFYVDGVANPATSFSLGFTFSWGFAIGARADTQGNGFLGKIDELAVYGRALTAAEVQAIYGAGNAGKCVTTVPPSIFTQPTNQTVLAGETASFAVVAGGTMPLSYQWALNGTNISGATQSILALSGVQFDQAGNYSVQVTNEAGGITSSNAVLTVNLPPPCTAPPAGLISWWRGEGNALDFAGGNSGIPAGGATYAAGKVGQAFSFNGLNQFIEVPHSASLNPTGSFTVEAWIFPTQDQDSMILTKWGDTGNYANNRSYQLTLHPGRVLDFAISDAANQWVSSFHSCRTTNAITLNAWNHVAGVYDQPSGTRRVFVNGVRLAEKTHAPITVLNGIAKVGIGVVFRSSTLTAAMFKGLIDEPAIIGRALADGEIQAIYTAGSLGKCAVPFPPFFAAQPTNQFVLAGESVTMTAMAGGTPPLSYQWTLNGTNLPGATTNTLSLPSATSANAGTYNLIVNNGSTVGAITSAPAFLDVRYALAYAASTPLFGSNYTFIGSAELTLHSVFPSANTFYTLDGSAPSYASCYYSGPVTVTRSSWLRLVTYSADFLQSWEAPALGVIIIPTYPVTATTRGGGTVTVVPPGGPYVSNSTVTVTATPESGWAFLQWLGDASGTNPSVQLTVNHPQRLEALFGTTLGTSIAGSGTLQVYPNLPVHPYGSVARLTALPQAGNSFAVWGNAASGNVNPLAFPITNATPTVSCLFAPLAAGQHALATVVDGFGRMAVNPRANAYANQTGVTLTAIPEPGQEFVFWSGDATGTQSPLALTMDASKTITAHFTRRPSLAVDAAAEWLGAEGCRLTLVGEVGAAYQIDTSTNLSDWAATVTLTNTYGRVQFNDLSATNLPNQFYRARQSP